MWRGWGVRPAAPFGSGPGSTVRGAERVSDDVKPVPPLEKVRLRKLTTTAGKVYAGVEVEYRDVATNEPMRLQFGLAAEDAQSPTWMFNIRGVGYRMPRPGSP